MTSNRKKMVKEIAVQIGGAPAEEEAEEMPEVSGKEAAFDKLCEAIAAGDSALGVEALDEFLSM